MAEENLGTAVLKIVVDDDQARATLDKLKSDIRQVETGVSRTTSTRIGSRATSGPSAPAGLEFGSISRQDVSRFNLRGFTATLQSIADELNNVATARNLNINSSWTAALSTLTEVQEDLQQLAAGKKLNINTSWTAALATLSEVQEGLQTISAGKKLNIDASWASALTTLGDIQQDIQTIASAKKLNIDASWTAALTTLSEVQQDLQGIAAAKKLNLDSSWNAALQELQQVQLDLQAIAATKRINIKSSWAKALDFLDETAQIISDTGRQRDIQEGLRIGRQNAVPIRGGAAFPGSPAFLDSIFPSFPKEYFAKQAREVKAASQKQQGIISNAIIGGAFPLLFGQGIGASIGGAAGGAAGGAIGGQFGFGLSLVGTAVGAQFDLAIQKLGALAKALDDPIANFQTLVQNASLSSKELERYAQALIESGRGAEAAAVIQRDLIGTFGSLQGAKEYNDAVDTISRAWSEASTVLASFVAGPLAALIRTLSQPTGGLATGVSFEQLVGQLSPDQFRQVQARREQVTEASRQARGGLSAILPPSNEDVNAGLRAGIALAKELLGIEKQRAELAARIAFAQIQNQKSLSTSYQLIDASTQGYERQSLELQKQQVLNERNRKLLELTDKERNDPTNPKAVKIQQDAALELYRLTQQLNQLDKDRAAQKELEAAQNNIKLQSINRQITATQALSKAERGVARDTLATTQNIQAGIDAAKDREREIGAQIDAARQRGGDAGEQEAFRLVQEQKVAASQTRLELEKGALALKEAGEQLRDNLRGAVVEFTRVRSDPQGLNRFLDPVQRQKRAEFDFQTLLPQFREAQGRFQQLTGQLAPEFTGPTAGVNEAIRDFINSVQAEDQVTRDLVGTQQALATVINAQAEITNANTQATNTLSEQVLLLTQKDWNVYINNNYTGSAASELLAAANF